MVATGFSFATIASTFSNSSFDTRSVLREKTFEAKARRDYFVQKNNVCKLYLMNEQSAYKFSLIFLVNGFFISPLIEYLNKEEYPGWGNST